MAGGGDNSTLSVLTAVAANFIVTVAKYIGYALTGSPALLAEAVHSTADVGNQVLLWIGIQQSKRAATPKHPFGWGPARYMWNLMSAMGIFFLGCGVTLFHGGHEIHAYFAAEAAAHAAEAAAHGGEAVSQAQAHSGGWIGIWILLLAFVLEGGSLIVAIVGISKDKGDLSWREFIFEGDDPTAVGVLFEDAIAVLGVVVAMIGIGLSQWLDNPLPDAISSVFIGLLLGVLAVFLAQVNGRLLIGAAVSDKDLAKIKQALESDDLVEEVRDLRTRIMGQGMVRVTCEVVFYEQLIALRMRDALRDDVKRIEQEGEDPAKVLVEVVGRTVRVAGDEIDRLEQKVREAVPRVFQVDLELE